MFARGLSILLIATLLACPAFCGQGVCGCAEECTARKECDGCRSEGCPQQGSHDEPAHPVDGPCDSCQCICGGAMLEKSPDVLPLLTQDVPIDCRIEAGSSSSPSPAAGPLLNDGRDDRLALSAREIRTLHMSLLC